MLCPWQVCQLQPPPAAIDELHLFPFLDDDVTVNALKQELLAFMLQLNFTLMMPSYTNCTPDAKNFL